MTTAQRALATAGAAIFALAGAVRGGVLFAALAVAAVSMTPPTAWVDPARFVRPRDAVEIVDRHGVALRSARVDGVDRRWVSLAEISPNVVDAFLAAEDARFREHHGVDAKATARAALSLVTPWRPRSGGSTITQQLVKLVYGRPLGPASKVLELARAAALERLFTKDEILEQYLNRVPFGDRIEGVARASESYFGVSVGALELSQAALLAGVPRAPSVTEPRRHFARALQRRAVVLDRLAALGRVDRATRDRLAGAAPHILAGKARPNEAPRFVDAVLARLHDGRLARDERGRVHTSLDVELQRAVEATLRDAVARFARRGVSNGAAIVVANSSGEVIAYAGSVGDRRGVAAPGSSLDLLTRARQPGSTLKPFAYELFFERGGTAAAVLDDIALPRLGAHHASFEAKDYDGTERGPVRARVALSASLNLAALDATGRVGQAAFVKRLEALGVRAPRGADHYGAAAVLGGLDVAPADLSAAYVALARGGTRVALSFGPSGSRAGTPVLAPEAAAVTLDVLRDGRARSDAFGGDLEDLAGGPFGLKTGTSSGYRDAWSAAFDDAFTVVVWLGDPGSAPLAGVSGFEAAAPTAARILAAAKARASDDDVVPFGRPAVALVTAAICPLTGLRAGPGCRARVDERFAPGTAPTDVCDAHDEHGDVELPRRYAAWIERVHPAGIARTARASAATTDDAPVVREPRDGARWLVDPRRGELEVPLRAAVAGGDVSDAAWEVDGHPVPTAAWRVAPGDHEIVAIWRERRSAPAHVHVDAPERR